MRKFTLLSAAVVTAIAANAQYTCNPETTVVAAQNPTSVQYIALSDDAVAELEAAGANCTYIGADDENCFLYIWEGTMVGGDSSYPGVDGPGEYPSFVVTNVGWSGAGYCFTEPYNLSSWNDNTRFHIAYMTSSTAPNSIALLISNDDLEGNAQGKIAVGDAFEDNGQVFPSVGPKANDDWQGIDISFADIKRLWPDFAYGNMSAMTGNIFSFLAGGVEGTAFAFDTLYFYNTDGGGNPDAGVDSLTSDALSFIVTKNTINLNGGRGIELYDMAGKVVKSTSGCVLGINNLPKGVYVAKSGKLVRKVVVR